MRIIPHFREAVDSCMSRTQQSLTRCWIVDYSSPWQCLTMSDIRGFRSLTALPGLSLLCLTFRPILPYFRSSFGHSSAILQTRSLTLRHAICFLSPPIPLPLFSSLPLTCSHTCKQFSVEIADGHYSLAIDNNWISVDSNDTTVQTYGAVSNGVSSPVCVCIYV